MHALHPLIADLTLITVYATVITLLFRSFKQPMVLGYLLAGILAGPYLHFLPTVSDSQNLLIWADIGVIFLLFGLGLEFSFKKLLSVGKSATITATLNIFLLLFLGHYTGLFLSWSTIDSFFLGSMISMSSTTIIIKAFDDLGIQKQKFTDLVFGVLVIEDMMGILLLVLLPTIALGNNINGEALGLSAFKLMFFLVLCFIAGIYLVPTMLQKIKPLLNDEMLLLLSVALSLSMVFIAVYSGFSSALGAFIMGSVLSETGAIKRIETVMKPLKDFFGAVFFVSVGMMVNPLMFVTYAYPIFIITLVVIIGKVTFSVFGFAISGQNLKTAVEGGFSLAQVGEFAFIIATLGRELGVLDGFVYPIIVAVSVVTTFLTPLMIKSADKAYKILNKVLPLSWREYINRGTKKNVVALTEEKLWRELFKSWFMRIFLFSVVLYAVMALMKSFVRPWLSKELPDFSARLVLTISTLVLMSPFLKGLIGGNKTLADALYAFLAKFGLKQKPESVCEGNLPINDKCVPSSQSVWQDVLNAHFVKKLFLSESRAARIYSILWYARASNRLPLLVLTGFRLGLVGFFIVMVVHQFLTENPKVTFLMLLITVALILQSKGLSDRYLQIENRFLNNLQGDAPNEEK